MLNACTIDVEDYFQVSGFENVIDRSDWPKFESRVVESTHVVLEAMAGARVRGTFFILGCVAEKHPNLVREIHSAGHEIGSHGDEHRLIHAMGRERFRVDLRRSKERLQSILGVPIHAFRAPSFSITRDSLWALETLVEEGFRVDSSIFPIVHDRYGIPDAPIAPFRIHTPSGDLTEFPPAVYPIFGLRLPVAGGGYFRLYPHRFTLHAIRRLNRQGRPANLYLHPWEFDPEQPRLRGIPPISRWRHYVNLSGTRKKFAKLLRQVEFGTMGEALGARRNPLDVWEVRDGALVETDGAESPTPLGVDGSLSAANASHRPEKPVP